MRGKLRVTQWATGSTRLLEAILLHAQMEPAGVGVSSDEEDRVDAGVSRRYSAKFPPP
jgi:hypothetical protein